MYSSLNVAKSSDVEIIEFVLPNAVLPSEIIMANVRVTLVSGEERDQTSPAEAENSPTEKTAKSKKKRFCRFFQAVWKAVKRPFKRGKNKVTPFVPPPESDDEVLNPEVLPDACLENPRLEAAADKPQQTPSPTGACAAVPLMMTDACPAVPLQKTGAYPIKLGLRGGGIFGLMYSDPDNHKPKDATDQVNPERKNETKPANPETKADIDPAGPVKLGLNDGGISGPKAGTTSDEQKPKTDLASPQAKAEIHPAVTNPVNPMTKVANPDIPSPKAGTNPASPNINTGAIPKILKKIGNAINPKLETGINPAVPKKIENGINPVVPKAGTDPVAGPGNPNMQAGVIPKRRPEVNPESQKPEAANPKLKADTNLDEPEPSLVTDISSIMPLFGKYTYNLEKVLGRGSFGSVYEGIRKLDSKKVAIKRVRLGHHKDRYLKISEHPKPIPAEVALMLNMGPPISPYVIQMYEWYEEANYITLVLEYIHPSETLHHFIKSQDMSRLTEPIACRLMRQAVLAVKHCLKHGIFHSDLHSSNFLVDRERMKLKLIDFGCAHVLSHDGYLSKYYIGALSYRPPESFKRIKYYAVPTNAWSLGVLLYKMVHGFMPFPRDVPEAKDFKILNQLLSSEICDLITRCLSIDPDKRPTIEQILAHPWF